MVMQKTSAGSYGTGFMGRAQTLAHCVAAGIPEPTAAGS